ncbi:class I SAM-dependent methyltransferase [Citricoccus zhacaiensis]|uniref:class I SAM-dependent methyltransferase n=2 Tax=Citricoccus TaxID=169133 RepID=UPI003CECCEAC
MSAAAAHRRITLPGVPDLSVRRPEVPEQMDSPDCDLAALHRTYAGFRAVNTVVAGWQLTYRTLIRPALAEAAARTGTGGGAAPDRGAVPVTVLDIGAGGGDVARALLHRARRDGFTVHVTAVDPDARAHAWASGRPPEEGLEILRALSGDLVREGRRFDVVISNHLLHHLDPAQLDAVLADSEALATVRAVHSDIRRAPAAYALFSAGTLPFFPRSYIRADGLASIRRSYTPAELAAAVRPGWRVQAQVPWRNLAIWDAAGRHARDPKTDAPNGDAPNADHPNADHPNADAPDAAGPGAD